MASLFDPVGSWIEAVTKGYASDLVVYGIAAVLIVVGLIGLLGPQIAEGVKTAADVAL